MRIVIPWASRVRLGLDIAPDAVTFVRLRRRGRRQSVVECRREPLPSGLLTVSPVEPNVTDLAELDRALRAVVGARVSGPVVLSLPDPSARVSLFDVAQLPPQHRDVEGLVRWHLEKTFSIELPAARFIYQRCRRSDGEPGHRILAAAMSLPVLAQYEQAVMNVGLEPRVVDLSSFHRFNLFRSSMTRLATPDQHFIVLSTSAAALTFMLFEGGTPTYLRIKGTRKPLTGPDAAERIVDEVEMSLNAYGKEKDLSGVTHLFVSAADGGDDLPRRLQERFHLTVHGFGPLDLGIDGVRDFDQSELVRVSAALGAAAER